MDPKIRAAFLYTMSKLDLDRLRAHNSAWSLVRDVFDLVTTRVTKLFKLTREQRNLIFSEVLEDVAKGADGILGTSDDLMTGETLMELQHLVRATMLQHLAEMMDDLKRKQWCSLAKRLPFCCYSIA